jgi:hypothetical protein
MADSKFVRELQLQDTRTMRTTVNLDDDVLAAAKQLARERASTLGQTLSDIARRGLQPGPAPQYRNGVPLLATRPGPPFLERRNLLAQR